MSNLEVSPNKISELRENLLKVKNSLLYVISKAETSRTITVNAVSMIDSINVMLLNGVISEEFAGAYNTKTNQFNIALATTNLGKVNEITNYFNYNQIGASLVDLFNVEMPVIGFDVEESKISFAVNARIKSMAYSADEGLKDFIVMADDSGIIVNHLSEIISEYQSMLNENPLTNMDKLATNKNCIASLNGSDGSIIPFLPGVISARFGTNEVLDPLTSILEIEMDNAEFSGQKDVANNVALLDIVSATSGLELDDVDEPITAAMHSCISLAVKGREVAKGSGTMPGCIKLPEVLPGISSLAGLAEFGYNPIFYVPHEEKMLGDIHPRVRTQFDHRSEAISTAFADLFYKMAFGH